MSVWVVAAGKGGVGTSTLASVMAVEAGLEGYRTLLVDGNVGGAGLHRVFGLTDGAPGLASLRDRTSEPSATLLSVSPNVALLPGGEPDPDRPFPGPGERSGLYRRILRMFDDYDVVLIDGGASLDSVVPALDLQPRGLWAVTLADRAALAGCYAAIKVLSGRRPGLPVVPLFNRTLLHEADSLFAALNGATLRFLQARLAPASSFPAVSQLQDADLLDVLRTDGPGDATRALVARMVAPLTVSA